MCKVSLLLPVVLVLTSGYQLIASGQPNSVQSTIDERLEDQSRFINGETGEAQQHQDIDLKRAFLLRELDLDGSLIGKQLSNKELVRRVRLNQLLDAISTSIPSSVSATPIARQQQRHEQTDQNSLISSASTAPIFRSGRTYPSPLTASTSAAIESNNFRTLRLAPIASDNYGLGLGLNLGHSSNSNQRLRADLVEPWQTAATANMLLDARAATPPKSRKSTILGIVWPHERVSLSPTGTPPTFYTPPSSIRKLPPQMGTMRNQRQQDQLVIGPSISASALTSTIYGANQQRARNSNNANANSNSGPSSQLQVQHRTGSEEVALHTPIHSQSASDYEWKRVEQSRWNNLRGMWGKRAISEANLAQRFKELLAEEENNKLDQVD